MNNKLTNMKKYDVKEFAELVGVSAYTVRRWIKEKKIIAELVKYQGFKEKYLIPESELKKVK